MAVGGVRCEEEEEEEEKEAKGKLEDLISLHCWRAHGCNSFILNRWRERKTSIFYKGANTIRAKNNNIVKLTAQTISSNSAKENQVDDGDYIHGNQRHCRCVGG